MLGYKIFTTGLTQGRIRDRYGNEWQYHSRSDAHSKFACWGIMLDLLMHCRLLAEHAEKHVVGFGINHEMHDFRVNRKKALDLVVCTPAAAGFEEYTLADLAEKYTVELSPDVKLALETVPAINKCSVGSTLVALEAKACMTEHIKACPRLYDELSSSYQTIVGDTSSAIAAAFVSVNVATDFISPGRNKMSLAESQPIISEHRQPYVTKRVVDKILELPRRSDPEGTGFDAVGLVLVECRNDGSDVMMLESTEGVEVPEILKYEMMIERISHLYTTRFKQL